LKLTRSLQARDRADQWLPIELARGEHEANFTRAAFFMRR
jgi:hypothetical protein